MENYYVSIIRRCELSYIRCELEKYGLIPLEGRILRLLKDQCCSQDYLGEILDIDKGRIAKTIFSLEEKKLICRAVNEKNRRQKLVSLTEKGMSIYETLCVIYKKWDNICYTGFTQEERMLNTEFVKRISKNVVEYKKENGGKTNG